MADISVQGEADELAVAMVQAIAKQDGDQALAIGTLLAPAIHDRPTLLARHAAWTAQAHLLRREYDLARAALKRAIALAEDGGEVDALPSLRKLSTEIFQTQAQAASAQSIPLPETMVGRALAAIGDGDFGRGTDLALSAREAARATGDAREEVLSLLALAQIPGRADAAVRDAHKVADASSDKNLVTAVAKAARAAGVDIPKQVF
jgi:hypothetical protein